MIIRNITFLNNDILKLHYFNQEKKLSCTISAYYILNNPGFLETRQTELWHVLKAAVVGSVYTPRNVADHGSTRFNIWAWLVLSSDRWQRRRRFKQQYTVLIKEALTNNHIHIYISGHCVPHGWRFDGNV
jgi:hypothetical protein